MPDGNENIPDARVNNVETDANPHGGPRSGILIHPDGGGTGTLGCIGIIGNGEVQQDFMNKMDFLINQNNGKYILKFDTSNTGQEMPGRVTGIPNPTKEKDKYKTYIEQLYKDL
jgi:hypothetical protein